MLLADWMSSRQKQMTHVKRAHFPTLVKIRCLCPGLNRSCTILYGISGCKAFNTAFHAPSGILQSLLFELSSHLLMNF